MNVATDNSLMRLLAEGDETAFTQIYQRHGGDIYQAAMAYLKDDEMAKEVVQEVFLKLWDKRETLAEIKKVNDFLFILARNTIYDHFRKQASERKAIGMIRPLKDEDHFQKAEIKDYRQLLQEAIDTLPPQQQKVFILAKQEGFSYEEIAEKLGISKWTVKNHMAQALDSLRLILKENPLLLLFFLLH